MTFTVGDKVQARYGGKARWYGAQVFADNGDGTYELRYDDGDTEKQVKTELIRHTGERASPPNRANDLTSETKNVFTKGQKIEARYGGKRRYYGGTIVRSNGDGTYEIRYEDNDVEKLVSSELIRALDLPVAGNAKPAAADAGAEAGAEAAAHSTPKQDNSSLAFAVGDKVQARYGGKARWYGAQVVADNGDGTYELRYDDGDTEKQVKTELIRSSSGGQEELMSKNTLCASTPSRDIGAKANAATVSRKASISPGSVPDTLQHEDVINLRHQISELKAMLTESKTEAAFLREERAVRDALTRDREMRAQAKLKDTLQSLTLLREAPTKWDRVRSSVFKSYAAEAIARNQEVTELKQRLQRFLDERVLPPPSPTTEISYQMSHSSRKDITTTLLPTAQALAEAGASVARGSTEAVRSTRHILHLTFRALASHLRSERDKRAVETRFLELNTRRKASIAKRDLKISNLTLQCRNLEDELGRRPITSEEPALRREVAELNKSLRIRTEQLQAATVQNTMNLRLESLLENTQKALNRAQTRERVLEKALAKKNSEVTEALRLSRNEIVATKASCERRVQSAEKALRMERKKRDIEGIARGAEQKYLGDQLRYLDKPETASARPAIYTRHGTSGSVKVDYAK